MASRTSINHNVQTSTKCPNRQNDKHTLNIFYDGWKNETIWRLISISIHFYIAIQLYYELCCFIVYCYTICRNKIVPLKCYFLIKFQDIGRKSLSLIWWACHVLATWIEFSARGGMYHHATVKTCRSWKFFRPCNVFLEQ